MKRLLLLLCAAIFALMAPGVADAQVGCTTGPYPTSGQEVGGYGYAWADETAGGDAYSWMDIELPANEVAGLTDDNFVGPFSLGTVDFPYFWYTVDDVYIGSNGYIMFNIGRNVASGMTGFVTFPTPGAPSTPNNHIGPFVSDLTLTDVAGNPVSNAKVYKAIVQDSMFVVTYKNVPYWSSTAPNGLEYQGSNTFQVILHRSGKIRMQYQSMSDSVHSSYLDPDMNWVTRGFENVSGALGLCLPSNVEPADNSAITITRPASTTFQVTDLAVEYIQTQANIAVTAMRGQTVGPLSAEVRNVGTVAITSPFQLELRATDFLTNNVLLRDTVLAPSLQPGQFAIVNFNDPVPTDGIANMRVRVRSLGLQGQTDAVADNDTRFIEYSILDTNTLRLMIGYDRFMFEEYYGAATINQYDLQQDGFAAGLPVGVYYTPPFYPATVEAVDLKMWFFVSPEMANNPSTYFEKFAGYTIELFNDNAGFPAAQPFQSIHIDTLAATWSFPPPIANDQANPLYTFTQTVALPTPVTLTSGGLFISYIASEVDTINNGLCNDQDPAAPVSFRVYEVTGGGWAPHRDIASQDIAMRIGIQKPQDTTVGVADGVARYVSLGQNFPNPASSLTTVPFSLSRNMAVQFELRDVLGRTVHSRDLGNLNEGFHAVELDGMNLSGGMYFYSLVVNGERITKRLSISR